jgi:hypothetical protein
VEDGPRRTADTFALMVEREIVAIDALRSSALSRCNAATCRPSTGHSRSGKRRPIWNSVYLIDMDGRVLLSTNARSAPRWATWPIRPTLPIVCTQSPG